MSCEKCIHLVSGTCEIYGDSLPDIGNGCQDMDSMSIENTGFEVKSISHVPERDGISDIEYLGLLCLEAESK